MKHALSVTRAENFADWYQDVIQAADMAEHSGVRGCMIMKPWGFGIWERLQARLDTLIKQTGHQNCYFPILIPVEMIEREATHVEGFAKEMAVVTHHRLVNKNGKLVPEGELESPLIIRPTSETIFGDAMSRWIKSYRDLPMKLNQWCNVMRWEMRTRLFLRTSEFLWQEGHTAHATEQEAREETALMLECYRQVLEDDMRIPGFIGQKSPDERFPGAVETHTIEAMMQDGRALQSCTSHYLGQNFSKAANIQFQDKEGGLKLVHTTSWGLSTRTIGGVIMVHGDDDGLRLPPLVAPMQIVIVPIIRDEETKAAVLSRAEVICAALNTTIYRGERIRAQVDHRDDTPQNKRWSWIKKGVPLVCELGPRDVAGNTIACLRRDRIEGKAEIVPCENLEAFTARMIEEMSAFEKVLYDQAKDYQERKTRYDIQTFDEMKQYFEGEDSGFVVGKWCDDPSIPERLSSMGVTVRCIPNQQSGTIGKCLVTGKDATIDAVYARSY
jgi:prolyl-tRNA synthetase